MSATNMKGSVSNSYTYSIHRRVRTAKEARQLLESLRAAYQSLAPEERRGVKGHMAVLLESQRRFGDVSMIAGASWSDGRSADDDECRTSTEARHSGSVQDIQRPS
jgi:hypothetical protein